MDKLTALQTVVRGRLPEILMVALLVVGCLTLGYAAGLAGPAHPASSARSGGRFASLEHPARPASDTPSQSDPLVVILARQRAALLRLQSQLQHVADMAGLDAGEFDLDLGFDLNASHPSSRPTLDTPRDPLGEAGLLMAGIDHMKSQLDLMMPIFSERRLTGELRLSGRVLAGGQAVSSRFGFRDAPFGGERSFHKGVDFPGEPGEPILAMAAGVVTYAGPNGAYGNLVEIEHADGYRTRYAHNERNLVRAGQRVAKGQAVATLGDSGRTTGAHLHLEVRHQGEAIDPMLFLRPSGG